MNNAKEVQSNSNSDLGSINITIGVLQSIAAKAASEVKGVSSSSTTLQKEAGAFLGFAPEIFQTAVRSSEDQLIIDVRLSVRFGYNVPEVAMEVQNRIREQILFMTDLEVSQVNVHIEEIGTGAKYIATPKDGETGE